MSQYLLTFKLNKKAKLNFFVNSEDFFFFKILHNFFYYKNKLT